MAYTAINDPGSVFSALVWSGAGGAQSITGVGFQPDVVWGKNILATANHQLLDSPRGVGKPLEVNTSDEEKNDPASSLSSFDADGFTLAGGSAINASGTNNIVSWNWKLGTTSGLSGGDITPSAYSINTSTGMGVYAYRGTGVQGAEIVHGLGATPTYIIIKQLTSIYDWAVWSKGVTLGNGMRLNETVAQETNDFLNNVAPTSTVVELGNSTYSNAVSGTKDYVMYAFVPKQGFSSIGTYTGNNNADGAFVNTGFAPAFVMVKNYTSADNWVMKDNKRPGYNESPLTVYANTNAAQSPITAKLDLVSNGFKWREAGANFNDNGSAHKYTYLAFAESPFVNSEGVPNNAK